MSLIKEMKADLLWGSQLINGAKTKDYSLNYKMNEELVKH